MALIKCNECGHEVSDKASICPNCGCPIEEMTSVHERDHVEKGKRKNKSLLWVSVVLLACFIGGSLYYVFKNGYIFNEKTGCAGLNTEVERNIKGKYAIILYNDNVGEFYNPQGGRMCSFRLMDGRKEPLTLKLSQSLYIMGTSTDRLYLTHERLFVEHMDYLKYNSSYNPDKSLGVAVEKKETDDGICFIVSISPNMIEQKKISVHQIKVSDDIDFSMLYYNDEYGILFNNKGERLCGVSKGVTIVGDLCIKLSKPISMYGVTTSELSIKGDNLYTSDDDLIDDRHKRDNEPSKKKASVKRVDDKDVTIFTFSKISEKNDADKPTSNHQDNISEWTISSVEELRKKIVGTVWTCRPTGKIWYRLVFTETNLTLYYAQPSQGRWMGGKEADKWCWEAKQVYTSDTGEKCYTIQIKKQDDNFSYGALMFFKDGEIQFNWLRGREGGNAECKDFNWE